MQQNKKIFVKHKGKREEEWIQLISCVNGESERPILCAVQVLNGLMIRDNQKEAISIPIGIIPAGSDNSLVWTVLGVRDPISAAISIVKVSCC